MIQVALVGCAHIHTPNFIKLLNRRREINVRYVWDHDAGRAQQRAGELRAQAVTDLTPVRTDREVSGVIICSETNWHEALVLQFAAAKKHLFVEKPLGMGAKDAYLMAKAIDEAGVIFHTGYFMRGHPIHLFLKEHIENGSFGQITRIRHTTCHAGLLKGWFDDEWRWMADVRQAGVGAFGDLGTHSLDILMWLMGDIERVTASIDSAIERYDGCDEYGEGLLKFAGGAVGSLAAGWVDVVNPVGVTVSGTQGHAHVIEGRLYFVSTHVPGADGKRPWTALPPGLPHAFDLFLDALAGLGDVPLVSPYEAAARCAVMEALYQAARDQTWVTPAT